MALTVTSKQGPTVPGAQRFTVTEATFDSSYAEGGETFTPANAGLTSIDFALCNVIHGDEAKTLEQFVGTCYYESEKLHLIDAKTGKEVAATGNMEKVKVIVLAFGH